MTGGVKVARQTLQFHVVDRSRGFTRAPQTLFGDRINQVDFRVAKVLRFGRSRAQVGVDIFNLMNSIVLLADGCTNFRKFMIEGAQPNLKAIKTQLERSLMLVTALAPVIGYDKASQIAHHATEHDLTLKQAALQLGFVTEAEFDRIVDPAKMVHPYVAS